MKAQPRPTPQATSNGTPERYIGVAHIKELFSTSDRNVRRWISAGKLRPYLRVGKMLRFKLSDVQRFIEENRIG